MMGSICADHQNHKFHHSHQLHHLTKKSPIREIDIPPRKLLAARRGGSSDVFAMDSPNADHAVFSRFLPCNRPSDDDSDSDDDPYSSDHFRIFEFKIRKCNRSRSHDWTDCPFAHPGEKARRRDPRRFHYSGTVCPDFRKGHCSSGDNCDLSHGVFECWLHPSRYRTEACKDGKHCKRKVCFFAHSPRQLRIVPESSPSPPMNSPTAAAERKSYCHNYTNHHSNLNLNPACCIYCNAITASPSSSVMCMSHVSPPASPSPSPPFDRRHVGLHEFMSGSGLTYEEALIELMASCEVMGAAEPVTTPGRASGRVGPSKLFRGELSGGRNLMEDSRFNTNNNDGNMGGPGPVHVHGPGLGPDLGWVNDLLT